MIIDLRSDTVTKPTPGMLDAMRSSEVGDDVFGEDPTVNRLEEKTAHLFGMEAGLFCPSGTMTNQIAIKAHTQPGDEVICDVLSHIYNFEGGGIAVNAGCSVKLLQGDRGRFTVADVERAINPDDVHFPVSRLVAIENTCNKGGGSVWNSGEVEKIGEFCRKKNLKLHIDGARIFNAYHAGFQENFSLAALGNVCDSLSVCLSKGLGAPAGSVLLGNRELIKKGRRIRKVFGGGMRQAGYIAAAGIYALDHHEERLTEDHRHAKTLESTLKALPYVKNILPVETNIVIFELQEEYKVQDFIAGMLAQKIKVVQMGPQRVRMVTHLDFTGEMLEEVVRVLKKPFI